ncbi:MAG TPA: FtsW/RodA/SpoVE family cell cycle protein [Tepidisphaeraceae bacterium]|jgi:cell division protein FtsW (lipid II flippase)|nr:FtsW/RodA/SpoVE family cell cycle protein [Tepidisphaeraceae bacterium]
MANVQIRKTWQRLAIATNWPVLVAVAVLSAMGIISIIAASHDDGIKQCVFLGVAVACMGLFQAVNYQKIGRFAWGFYILSLLLVAYTVVGNVAQAHHHPLPGVHSTKGVCAWINFGPISLEPAELMKVAFVLLLARYLRFRNNYRRISGLLPPFLLALVPLILILKQPDLGMAMLFLPVLFTMLFVAGAKIKHLALIVGAGLLITPIVWFSGTKHIPVLRHFPEIIKPYQRERVRAFLDSDNPAEQQRKAYQTYRAMVAFASGGMSGKGFGVIPIGQSVPEAHNDMIFALIGEQFGFFGAAVMLGAYIVLFAAGIEIAAATREPFGRLIAVGIIATLACQSFINLMVCTGLFPVTGITLPFVSYGGSSMVASFMAAGLLLNVGQNRPLVMARESFDFD